MIILPLYRDGGKITKSLVALGLADYSSRGAALTKKGKAVLEALRAFAPSRDEKGGDA
jgi:predicted transcriptional regulator